MKAEERKIKLRDADIAFIQMLRVVAPSQFALMYAAASPRMKDAMAEVVAELEVKI